VPVPGAKGKTLKVAVVGAGIAGLSAARALQARGHVVRVFDRAQAVGGRCATRVMHALELPRGLSGEVAFDHGAQYFTVRDERFAELAAEWERDRVIARWTGRIVAFDGGGWDDLNTDTRRYVGTPSMKAIATHLANGLDIVLGERVDALPAMLAAFDHVIVALPADVAKLLATELSPLADLVTVAMTPCWTVMAAFEERVPARFDAGFVANSPLRWIARNSSKPKRNWKIDTWVLHASALWSHAHATDPPDDVGSFLMEAFDDLIPAGLPRAFHASVHRWRYASADPALAIGAMYDAENRVTLCGDWCRGSRIEDAYLSGLEAALGLMA